MKVVVIINALGETVVHKPGCLILSSEALEAQGPAATFDQEALRDFEPEEFAALWTCECLEAKNGNGKAVGLSRQRNGRTNGSRPVGSNGDRTKSGPRAAERNGAGRSRGSATVAEAGAGSGRPASSIPGGLSKPDRFAADAKAAGWDPEISHDGNLTTVVARRGEESVTITWAGEACRDGSMYRLGSYERTLRNAAACRRQLAISPEEAAKTVANRKVRRVGAKTAKAKAARLAPSASDTGDLIELDDDEPPPYQGNVPFSMDAPADEICAAVIGKEILWKSRINQTIYSAHVMTRPNQRQLRVERHPRTGMRILTFAAADQGFRSVYLSSIIDVQ